MNKETLTGLRQKRGQLVDGMKARITLAEKEDRDFTPEELEAETKDNAALTALDARIDRVVALEAELAKNAATVEPGVNVTVLDPKDPKGANKQKGARFARMVVALAAAKGVLRTAAAIAQNKLRDSVLAKALAAGDDAAGGFMVQEDISGDFIELLRHASVLRSMNPQFIPMPLGNSTINGLNAGATASYIGENKVIAKSEPTFRQVKLVANKIATLVPISNDLLRVASPGIESMVLDDMLAAMAERSDLAMIRGDGTQDTPKGLLNWATSGNKFNANGTINLTNTTKDLGTLALKLKQGLKRQLRRPGLLFSSRTEVYLLTVRDGNGNLAYRDELLRGRLNGWPFGVTDQIPENLGGGSDESEIYAVDFGHILVGENPGVEIVSSNVAAYDDGGTLKSALSLDQTVVLALTHDDLAARHTGAIAVMQAVKWTL